MPTIKIDPESKLPVSEGVWLLKNVPGILNDPLQHFYRQGQRLGRTYELPVPRKRVIATADPAFIQHVLQKNHRNYKKSPAYKVLKLFTGNGLISSNGSFWQKQRRLAQPAFHKKNLESLFEVMGETVGEYLEELAQKRGNQVDMAKEMMAITAKIALKALFSNTPEEDLETVYESMTESLRYISDSVGMPFSKYVYKLNGRSRKFVQHKAIIDQIVHRAIEARRNSQEKHPDLLQMLLDATEEGSNDQMTDQQLKDELITIFLAGHETSANALAWTLYLLSQHPEVIEKMRAEIASTVGNELPGFQDLRQLSYTRQVIEEGMRLYPPAWGMGRTALGDDEFDGVKIHQGDTIALLVYNVHHSPEIYTNPEDFDPDRFAPERVKERPKMSYVPFGAGPRMCIGYMFALMEMQLLMVGLFQRFDFELVDGQNMEMEALVTLRPKNGVWMRVKGR